LLSKRNEVLIKVRTVASGTLDTKILRPRSTRRLPHTVQWWTLQNKRNSKYFKEIYRFWLEKV